MGASGSDECVQLMQGFQDLCEFIAVPLAQENTMGPCTNIIFLYRFRNRHLRHGCKNPTRKNTAINFTSNIKFDQKISPASRNSEYCWELKIF